MQSPSTFGPLSVPCMYRDEKEGKALWKPHSSLYLKHLLNEGRNIFPLLFLLAFLLSPSCSVFSGLFFFSLFVIIRLWFLLLHSPFQFLNPAPNSHSSYHSLCRYPLFTYLPIFFSLWLGWLLEYQTNHHNKISQQWPCTEVDNKCCSLFHSKCSPVFRLVQMACREGAYLISRGRESHDLGATAERVPLSIPVS